MSTMLRAVVVGINEYADLRYREEARLRYAQIAIKDEEWDAQLA